MKKNILKSLLIFLILPVLILVGCKNKSLPSLNLSTYLKDTISITRYDLEEPSNASLSFITDPKLKKENLSKYLNFDITANNVWMYKMYVETISFYVYCNETSEYQMTINVKMTDLASEETILNSTTENVETETVQEQVTFTPKANKSIKCTFKINKTVINALGSNISIDVYNSPELFSNESTFTWMIYGLEIHGESRTYSR